MAKSTKKATDDAGNTGAAFVPVQSKLDEQTARMLEATNPLRGLSAKDIENILDYALGGSISRLQLIYERLEASCLDIAAVLMRRESALVGCDWEIRQRSTRHYNQRNFDQVLADEQQAMLSEQFSRAEDDNSLLEAIKRLQSAVFRGLAVVQPKYDQEGLRSFELFDAWNFCIDTHDTLFWNPSGMDRYDYRSALKEVPEDSVIKSVKKRPVDGLALPIYIRQQMGEENWARFMARRGLPSCYIIAPGNLGNTTMDSFAAAARKCADGGSGALPNGSQVVTEKLDSSTSQGFQTFLDHQQKLIVLAATGGILGSLAEATGLGSGVADSHDKTWREIIKADAFEISGLIQRSVGARLLDAYFPGKPKLAYFAINAEAPQSSADVLDCVVKASQAGLKVDPAQVSEMTGFKFINAPDIQDPNAPDESEEVQEDPGASVENKEEVTEDPGVPGEQEQKEQPEVVENTKEADPAQAAATLPEDRTDQEKDKANKAAVGLLKGFDMFLSPLKAILSKLAKAKDDEEAAQLVQDAKARIALMEQQEDTEYSQAVAEYMDSLTKEEKEEKKDEQGA